MKRAIAAERKTIAAEVRKFGKLSVHWLLETPERADTVDEMMKSGELVTEPLPFPYWSARLVEKD